MISALNLIHHRDRVVGVGDFRLSVLIHREILAREFIGSRAGTVREENRSRADIGPADIVSRTKVAKRLFHRLGERTDRLREVFPIRESFRAFRVRVEGTGTADEEQTGVRAGEDIREVLSRGLVEREGFRRESSEPAHYGIKPGEVLSRQIENVLTDVSLRLRIVLFVTPESGYVETAGKGFRDNFAGSFAVRGDNCDFCLFEFCLIDVISVVLSVKKKYSEEKFRCQYFYYIKRNPEKISCLTLRPAALNAGVSS